MKGRTGYVRRRVETGRRRNEKREKGGEKRALIAEPVHETVGTRNKIIRITSRYV